MTSTPATSSARQPVHVVGAAPVVTDARGDWERRIYQRSTDTGRADPSSALPAPVGVRAEAGVGHVRLSWDPVAGAAGYVLERTDGDDSDPHIVGHGGADVPAVPACAFADTGLLDGVDYRYRVGAVAGAEHPAWNWSEQVSARTTGGSGAAVDVLVDAATSTGVLERVWHMIGSERLTQLRFGPDAHGHDIGSEFETALRQVHDDLGVRRVRAHAVLHDDNGVVTRAADGTLRFDFTVVDELYDRILRIGVRPVVELSFMPAAMAADAGATVFTYRGIISPPRHWSEWHDLVTALASHLVERYGVDEVATWGFEVWNEPNLVVFWTGTRAEYFRLYAEAARAVKAVDPRLRVGGPSTAASEWVDALAAYASEHELPLDFVTSHTYGNLPLDTRPALERHGFGSTPVWWTEWGAGSTHFGAINDSVLAAAFVLSGYSTVQGRIEALAYWVVSDHFEELGRPPRLFHDGFGLLTIGNLRKPRYWAAHLAAHLGDEVLASTVAGDGAGVLVQAWAARHGDGTVDVLVWNGTINGQLLDGDPRLDRQITVTLHGLPAGTHRVELARIDSEHSNIVRWCPPGIDWPDEEQFVQLRTHDVLDTEDPGDLVVTDTAARLHFALPMPGVARVRLTRTQPPHTADMEVAR